MPLYQLFGDEVSIKIVAAVIAILMVILAIVGTIVWVKIAAGVFAALLIWAAFGDKLAPFGIKLFNLIFDAIERSAH